ncbi:MAG: ABC transporter ATP-binding protein [Burkholderiales bacterium]|nr:ABC transporter ATP-binding protein [Burkholderiales bacterium]
MTPVVSVDALTKRYGPRLAVDAVSFDVGRNEVLGLLGPNGSGKSTILRILTGYLRPTAGTARIAGFDVAKSGLDARRCVGYVPEDIPLYPTMEVGEFLQFMGQLKGLAGAGLRRAVDDAVERMSLSSVRSLLIAKLSRGFRQRVAIAQALLASPVLLVLDEPTNGLDPRQIIEIREMIRTLAQSHSVLVTSHILGEIEKVAHRAAILLDGRLLSVESLDPMGEQARLRVCVQGSSAQQAQQIIASQPGVTGVRQEADGTPGHFTFILKLPRPELAAGIVTALVSSGFGVSEVAAASTDLEARFLQITTGKGSV